MKRLLTSILLFAAFLCGAQAQNDALFVYRNDGAIHGFLRADIDSMVCSQIDLDSLLHADYVVQEIWTADSVYRIPLAAIDSISFVIPETVYQPGTVNITAEMRDYVVSSDSLVLVFAGNTPQHLMPSVGDKLVNTEASGGLHSGFLGQVKAIEQTAEGYAVKCDPIDLTDVFECYYGIAQEQPSPYSRGLTDGFHSGGFEWNPGKMSVSLFNMFGSSISYEPDGNLLVPSVSDAECTVGLTPYLRSFSYLIVHKDYGVNLSVGLYGDFTLEEYLSFAGRLSGGGDIKLFDKVLFRCPEVLCDVVLEAGVFVNAAVEVSTQQKWTQRYKSAFHWEYSSRGEKSVKNENTIRNVENTHAGIVALKGICETGLYVNAGLAFIATTQLDIAEIGLRLEGGIHFDGTALPYVSNGEDAMRSTDLYNMMKGQGVELSTYYGTSFYAKMFGWSWNAPIPNILNIPFGKKHVWKSCYYVPEFANTQLTINEDGDYFASMDVYGNCGTTDIGFSLQCKETPDDRVDGYALYDYNGPSALASATFYSKPSSKPVIVYPMVKFGELEMIAEPSAELTSCPDEHHPHAIDLGLPSGTKWACCNIGASSPEGYGGYYAWGETSEKNWYTEANYLYFTGQDTDGDGWIDENFDVVDIGSDIAGTSYDVAHMKWGGSWVMPSIDRLKELVNNCSREWTTVNGVYGTLVTGPNGGQIFLPAAGHRWGGNLYSAGSDGRCWSSSRNPGNSRDAYHLFFYSRSWDWDLIGRGLGQSVRAVCP